MLTNRRDLLRLLLGTALASARGGPAAAATISPAIDASRGFVTTHGRQFLAADGQPLLLKGINLGNWLVPEGYMFDFATAKSPRAIYAAVDRLLGAGQSNVFWQIFRRNFIQREDIDFIAAAGFNTVRVPLHYAMFVESADGQASGEGWDLLDRLIDWCEAAGIYVILDMHAAPGGQTEVNHDDGPGYPMLFYVSAQQDQTAVVWRTIAGRYSNRAGVLGYDLLNEPISPYGDVRNLNKKLYPLYRYLINNIRTVDHHHIIFLGGAQWNTNFEIFEQPLDSSNIAYTYHNFWSSPSRAAIRQFVNFSYLYNVPIFLGESGEADDDWVKAFRELHEQLGIGWCFWTYKNMASEATVARVRRPANWDLVVALADGGAAAGADPAHPAAVAALAEYLENVKLENTTIQQGYLDALGLHDPR